MSSINEDDVIVIALAAILENRERRKRLLHNIDNPDYPDEKRQCHNLSLTERLTDLEERRSNLQNGMIQLNSDIDRISNNIKTKSNVCIINSNTINMHRNDSMSNSSTKTRKLAQASINNNCVSISGTKTSNVLHNNTTTTTSTGTIVTTRSDGTTTRFTPIPLPPPTTTTGTLVTTRSDNTSTTLSPPHPTAASIQSITAQIRTTNQSGRRFIQPRTIQSFTKVGGYTIPNKQISDHKQNTKINYWQTPDEIIKVGMKIKWIDQPPIFNPSELRNIVNHFKSAEEEEQVWKMICNYIDNGDIVEIDESDVKACLSLSAVPKKNTTEIREVINAKPLNYYIQKCAVKLPSLNDCIDLVENFKWACIVDCKNAFMCMKLHKESQPYVCVKMRDKYFKFLKVTFGISCAPACCQTITNYCANGTGSKVYLDDIVVPGTQQQHVLDKLDLIRTNLEKAKLIINSSKSILIPVQKLQYIGYSLDFADHKVFNQSDKIKEANSLISNLYISGNKCKKDQLHSLLGLINFMRCKNVDKEAVSKLYQALQRVDDSNNIELSDTEVNTIEEMSTMISGSFEKR